MKFFHKIILFIVIILPFRVFSQEPTAILTSDDARFCESGITELTIEFTGTPPFAFAYKIGSTIYWEGLDELSNPVKQTIFNNTYTFNISESSPQEVSLVRVYDNVYQINNSNRINSGTPNVSGSINIIIDQMPNPYAGINTSVCGLEYELQGKASNVENDVFWSEVTDLGSFEDISSPSSKFTANSPGIITFTLNEKNGVCLAESIVEIELKGSPTGTINTNTINFCSTDNTEDNIPIELNFNGKGNFTYEIKVGDEIHPAKTTSNFTESKTIQVDSTKEITINSLKDEATECYADKSSLKGKVVAQDLKPDIYAGKDTISCGNSITLNAKKNETHVGKWSTLETDIAINDFSIKNASVTNNNFALQEQVKLTWEVTEPIFGCSNKDDLTVQFVSPPTIELSETKDRICDESASYIPYVSTGNLPLTIKYSNNISSFTKNVTSEYIGNISISPKFDGISYLNSITTYSIDSITDSYGCISTPNNLQFEVTIDEKPIANAGEDKTVCGKSVELSATAVSNGSSNWKNNLGTFDDATDPFTTFESNDFGSIELIWSNTNGSCYTEDKVNINFLRQAYPVNAGNDTLIYGYDHIKLNASELIDGSGFWSIAEGSADIQNPKQSSTFVNNIKEGNYKFLWTASINNPECEAITDEINVKFKKIFVPNGFSPNGDGNYDYFKVSGFESVSNPKLIVFDKTGKLVFQNKTFDNKWDGKDNSGSELPPGTYYMVFEGDEIQVKQYLIIKH